MLELARDLERRQGRGASALPPPLPPPRSTSHPRVLPRLTRRRSRRTGARQRARSCRSSFRSRASSWSRTLTSPRCARLVLPPSFPRPDRPTDSRPSPLLCSQPGFEKQIGTAEATAASELYNERTLVLTRAFVKRACEYPPSSFAREIAAYFFRGLPGQQGGALAAIIEQSNRLLAESEQWHAREGADAEGDGDEAKPPQSAVVPSQRVLTEGAGLSLRRTVKALEELVKRGPKVDEAGAA